MSTETAEETKGLEAQEYADPAKGGLTAGLDKFFDDLDKVQVAPEPEAKEVAKEVESPTKEPEKEKVEEKKPIIEEDFFSDEEDEKEAGTDEKAFDEKAFDAETEEQVKGMDAKAGEKFKALKSELKALKQEQSAKTVPEETAKELEDLRLRVQEADGLKARLEEVTSKSAKLQVESSKEYEESILKPLESMFAKADEIAAAYEIDPVAIRAIIKERSEAKRDAMVEEFLEKVPAYNQGRIINFSDEFGKLLDRREDMLSKADETISRNEAAAIDSQKKLLDEQRRVTQTIKKDIFERYRESIPGFTDDGKETDAYKSLVAKALSIDFGKARARDQAFAAFAGVTLPHAVEQIRELQSRLAEYEAEDAQKVRKSPSSGGSVKATPAEKAKEAGFMSGFLNADFA